MQITIRLFAGLAENLGTSLLKYNIIELPITTEQLKIVLSTSYPQATSQIASSFVAINQEYASGHDLITDKDEIALIPPVSGGDGQSDTPLTQSSSNDMYVITEVPLSIEQVTTKVLNHNHGANLTFIGTTREMTGDQRTVHLEYEAYIPMALSTLENIGLEMQVKWPGIQCAISHRVGTVNIKEISVIIAVSTGHRDTCYEASRYAIERLKQSVPIWKKEIWDDGSEWKGPQGHWDPTLPTKN
ncbi:molybdopterin synthase catalytic subunit [Paenibacillus sp. DS2015]|uniref:molybdenum cofactor biosynthesis protein MoaE n=1 Tax=Paenibacillus sp. DS2015 TaxID=3373917 RepID=UPI003D1A2000